MTPSLLVATTDHKVVLENLMQFYIYDFSEYLDIEVGENGQFNPYTDLSNYWKDKDSKFPYLIKKGGKFVGFVLVKINHTDSQNYFSIAEFFFLKKYRFKGIGKLIAFQIFDLHKGFWEIFQREENKPAQLFWTKIIKAYTQNKFTERFENGKHIQCFKN